MAIRSDSFSSVTEVTAFTRHLLDGHGAFDTITRPTLAELEKFIDRASAVLNIALSAAGFTPATVYANAVAKLACDDWVTVRATKFVELTQRGTGWSADEGSRTAAFTMQEDANAFVESMTLGFINLGIGQGSGKLSDGLAFTGIDAQELRADPTDSSLAQPHFTRGQWDNA